MRNMCRFSFGLFGLLLAGSIGANAQDSDWQKAYPVSGKASLTISTGDASVELHSCSGCREVRIHVDWRDRKLSDFTLTEMQAGDHVTFELKEKPHIGIFRIGNIHEPRVTVETPEELDLDARTSDGALKVSGVNGSVQLHTSDGSVDVSEVAGSLHLTASDGSVRIHNVTGTLDSHSSDGHAEIDGKFTALQVHTSDGALDLTLDEGTQLASASHVEISDGRLTLRVPRTLSADLDVHSGDGGIRCDLPLTMNGYDSGHSSGHNLHGKLNSGGVPLTIHAGDGHVTIAAL